MKNLHPLVKKLLSKGCSQELLAKVAGVSQMSISRWSRENPRRVDTLALSRLEKYLKKLESGDA